MKFDQFEIANGGSDRIYYRHAVTRMGEFTTAFTFDSVTWQYGKLPTVFSDCDFENCVFDRVDLSYTVFLNCKFENCEFRRCKMDFAILLECSGYNLRFRRCEAQELMVTHSFIDGVLASKSKLQGARITVNSEYLAPIALNECDLDGANIHNIGSMQYESIFGTPVLGSKDRVSVKTERCRGNYSIVGFQYVTR